MNFFPITTFHQPDYNLLKTCQQHLIQILVDSCCGDIDSGDKLFHEKLILAGQLIDLCIDYSKEYAPIKFDSMLDEELAKLHIEPQAMIIAANDAYIKSKEKSDEEGRN